MTVTQDSPATAGLSPVCEAWWNTESYECSREIDPCDEGDPCRVSCTCVEVDAEVECEAPATARALMVLGMVSTGRVMVPVLVCPDHSRVGDVPL